MQNGNHSALAASSENADDSRQIMDALRRIVQLLRRTSNVAEKQAGMSAAQLFVLHKLADAGRLTVGELAERTLTSQSSVSEVVQKLVTAGLVERTRSSSDARSVILSLSEAGRKAVESSPAAPQDYLLAALHRMPPRDRKQLARLMTRLVKETGMIDLQSPPKMMSVGRDDSASTQDDHEFDAVTASESELRSDQPAE